MIQPRPTAAGAPDLAVGLPSVSNNAPAVGTQFILSAIVRNDGDRPSAATTLRYYRLTDATITTSDTAVATETVVGLAASGSSSGSVDLAAPSRPGTYYYGACVDTVAGESNTTNNCSPPLQVTVLETQQQMEGTPDLVVGSPSVSNSGPDAGVFFTLSATVRNDGNGAATAMTLRYYRSTDVTITTSDTSVGTETLAGLAASGSSSGSVDLAAPSSLGTYYYGACVDAVTDESDTTNNCSPSVQVDVQQPEPPGQGQPDLEVGPPSVSDARLETGASFTLSATVSNTGDGESVATTLRYYWSTDATITTSDTEVGTDAVSALSASGSSAESISLTAPSTAGTYYYGACVDAAVTDESDTTNNCSPSVQVDVQQPEPPGQGKPDLIVAPPLVSDSSPTTGASFTLSATVSNTGDGTSPATTLRYYWSTDATITTSDTEVGTDAVSALSASGSSAESISLTAPSTAGTYYYGACVDAAVTDESDTTNNCSVALLVTVLETSPQMQGNPDLIIDGLTVFTSPGPFPGGPFSLTATVRNDGDGASAVSMLRYYRSTDATITTSDTEVDTNVVAGLAPSESIGESVDLTPPSTAGTYYYGACVDAVADESDTTNNCSDSLRVIVESS